MEQIPEDIEKYLEKDEIIEKSFRLRDRTIYASSKRLLMKKAMLSQTRPGTPHRETGLAGLRLSTKHLTHQPSRPPLFGGNYPPLCPLFHAPPQFLAGCI